MFCLFCLFYGTEDPTLNYYPWEFLHTDKICFLMGQGRSVESLWHVEASDLEAAEPDK